MEKVSLQNFSIEFFKFVLEVSTWILSGSVSQDNAEAAKRDALVYLIVTNRKGEGWVLAVVIMRW